jgi:hypothetical protein
MNKTFTTQQVLTAAFALTGLVAVAQTPQIPFTNQTTLLPTSTFHSGNAVGVCDMNADGKDDIVRASGNSVMFIDYQNAPNATFTEASFGSNTIGDPWAMCVGDVDNNGYNDVLWGDYGNVFILTANSTGTSYTGTQVSNITSNFIFVQGANFANVNNDHFLDAFVCNDVDMPHIYVGNGTTSGWAMNQSLMPLATTPASDNSGNYASIWTDVNNDNLIDLMITHCRQSVSSPTDARRIDQVFINNGNGTYTQDITNWTGLRDGAQGWSTAWGDIDNDGDQDAFVLNYDVNSKLMINNGSGVFTNAMSGSGINSTTSIFGENATFHDFDNDGDLDLLISGDTHLLYMNNGNSTFTQVSPNPFSYNANQITAHAVGDLNGDGFLDVYASYCDIYNTPSSRSDRLWMNACPQNSNTNNYVMFDLVGGATAGMSNKNGIGAIVRIYGPWGQQVREVRSGEGYGIQNTFAVHFGLGNNTVIDSAKVIWPSGIIDKLTNIGVNQHHTVNEGAFTLGVKPVAANPVSATVIPNPVEGSAGIIRIDNYMTAGLENLSVVVYDINGKLLFSEGNLQTNAVSLREKNLTAGMYFFEVREGASRLHAGKFIVK